MTTVRPRLLGSLAVLLALAAMPAYGQDLPADDDGAVRRLDASSRHGEWVKYDAGDGDTVSAWVVFPERSDLAPVVVVIHEIFGLTDWIRAVADQLAAEGFLAIAPDLLSGAGPGGGGSESVTGQRAVRLVGDLELDDVVRRLTAAAGYATSLPAARDAVGSVGFCWGGRRSFELAAGWPGLQAALVYYGSSPGESRLTTINARVLGLYGGDDARVNRDIEPTKEAMARLGKHYEAKVYEGAGHGFLRAQAGRDGSNLRATQQAWPRSVAFLREVLGR